MPALRRASHAAVIAAWAGAVLFALSLLYFLYAYLIRFGADPVTGRRAPAVAINVLLFSAFALHHSILARAPVKERLQGIIAPLLERSVYTWTASVLFILVCWWWQPVPGELYRFSGPAALPGYLVQALGAGLALRGAARLDVLDLAGVRPVLEDRAGRHAVHVPLETRGLYGVVRHPIYLAWTLIVFGTPHMTLTRLVFAVVSTAYVALAIPFEERSLIQAFGAEYRAYRERVRWRMIPGVY